MNRREFSKLSAVAALTALLQNNAKISAQDGSNGKQDGSNVKTSATAQMSAEHLAVMKKYENLIGGEHLNIVMLVYPGMFLQDLIGPLTIFEAFMNRDIHLVWKDKNPLAAASLVPISATKTLNECPDDPDVLFVPGGVPGTIALIEDKEILEFLAVKGKTAKFVTSVCTGSLILGAAGLLGGYRATSHWATRDILKEFGAIPTKGRVVVDRNRITGGGVTAGIDFGLTLAAKLRSETYAKAIQLYLEYAPAPPFNSGEPETADKEAKQFITEMLAPFAKTAKAAADRATRRAN